MTGETPAFLFLHGFDSKRLVVDDLGHGLRYESHTVSETEVQEFRLQNQKLVCVHHTSFPLSCPNHYFRISSMMPYFFASSASMK